MKIFAKRLRDISELSAFLEKLNQKSIVAITEYDGYTVVYRALFKYD